MPTKRFWLGHAPDVPQIDVVEFDEDECTILAERSYLELEVNDKVIEVRAPDSVLDAAPDQPGDSTALVSLLQAAEAAINSSTIPEFAELEAAIESPDSSAESPYHRLVVTTREQFTGLPFDLDVRAPRPTIDVDVVQVGGPGQNEIQRFWISPSPTGGSYVVRWDLGAGEESSSPVPFDADADALRFALVAGMPSLSDGDLLVTGAGAQANPFVLSLQGAYAEAAVDELTVDASGLLGNGQVVVTTVVSGSAGRNELQRIQLSSGITGGTFTLTFDGQTTAAIAYNASAAALQSALEALSNIAPGDVSVAKSGSVWTVTFQGAYAGTNVPEMTGDGSSLTSSGGSLSIATNQQGLDGGFEVRIISIRVGHGVNTVLKLKVGTQYTPARALSSWTQSQLISDIQAITGSGTISLTGGFKPHSNGDNLAFAWKWIGAKAFATTSIWLYDSAGNFLRGDRQINRGLVSSYEKAEVQLINLTSATGGTYTLTFDGQTTGPLDWNASASTVQFALVGLSNIGASDVDVFNGESSLSGTGRHILAVKFLATYEDTDVPQLTIDTGSLTGGGSISTLLQGNTPNQRNEIQRIIVNASGGTFTLTFDGQTTGNISVGATAGDLQTALEGLSNIDPGDVSVSGAGTSVAPYLVEFEGQYAATNVPQLTGSVGGLTGGSVTVTTLTQGEPPVNEQQAMYIVGDGGTFTLAYLSEPTIGIAYDAEAAAVEAALELLAGIDDVTVSGAGTIEDPWLIEFEGSLAGVNVGQLVGNAANLTGGFSATIQVEQEGSPPLPQTWDVTLHCATGGAFAFSFKGRRTANTAYGSDAATVEAALEALAPGSFAGLWNVELLETDVYRVSVDGRLAGVPQHLVVHNDALTGMELGINQYILQPATGRNWIDNPVNWRDVATGEPGLPEAGDEAFVQTGDETNSLRYGSLAGRPLKRFILGNMFRGEIGLPERTKTGYVEYRPTHIVLEFEDGTQSFDDPNIVIGIEQGQGAGLVRLKTGDDEVHIRIERTGGPVEDGRPSFCWDGQNAANTLQLIEGTAGVAVFAFGAAQLSKVIQRGGVLRFGEGTAIGVGGFDRVGGEILGRVAIGGIPVVLGG
jgi:hypothetical protein